MLFCRRTKKIRGLCPFLSNKTEHMKQLGKYMDKRLLLELAEELSCNGQAWTFVREDVIQCDGVHLLFTSAPKRLEGKIRVYTYFEKGRFKTKPGSELCVVTVRPAAKMSKPILRALRPVLERYKSWYAEQLKCLFS